MASDVAQDCRPRRRTRRDDWRTLSRISRERESDLACYRSRWARETALRGSSSSVPRGAGRLWRLGGRPFPGGGEEDDAASTDRRSPRPTDAFTFSHSLWLCKTASEAAAYTRNNIPSGRSFPLQSAQQAELARDELPGSSAVERSKMLTGRPPTFFPPCPVLCSALAVASPRLSRIDFRPGPQLRPAVSTRARHLEARIAKEERSFLSPGASVFSPGLPRHRSPSRARLASLRGRHHLLSSHRCRNLRLHGRRCRKTRAGQCLVQGESASRFGKLSA